MRLSEIGEFGFINRIAAMGAAPRPSVIKGIGDDCAVIDVGGPDYLLVTTDLLVEKVHFLMDRGGPQELGAKAIAVNVSDIAACGGTPQAAFVSVAIPENTAVECLEAFYSGMNAAAALYEMDILGGDTTRSMTDLVVNVAVTGLVPKRGALYRKGAQPGDFIALTGPVGESAAGLAVLLSRDYESDERFKPLVHAHLRPRAHVKEGSILSESGVCHAAIDVSDGLSSDLGHICEESGVGAIVWEKDLHKSKALMDAGNLMGRDPIEWVLHGGEDYVLLAAVQPEGLADLDARFRSEGMDLVVIGRFIEGSETLIEGCDGSLRPLSVGGWDHFRGALAKKP
jgi:thiamine-monophosphate kinase